METVSVNRDSMVDLEESVLAPTAMAGVVVFVVVLIIYG
jgi:hypothetical protein